MTSLAPAFRRAARIGFIIGVVAAVPAAESTSGARPVPPQPSGELGTFAAMGSGVARTIGLTDVQWTDAQFEAFIAGLRAAHAKQPYRVDAAARRLLEDTQRRAAEIRARENVAESPAVAEFLRTTKARAGMQESESGLLYRVILPGAGPRPRPEDTVVARFTAKMPDGSTDIPQLSGQNIRIKVSELPPGLVEGLQMIALGGHAIFAVPPRLSFGNGEWPEGLPPGTPILLQIDLEDVIPASP